MFSQKEKILRQIEETWRLKSRKVWLEARDNNTIFFHKYSNQRRISNSIWEMKNSVGEVINEHRSLNIKVVNYFKDIYNQDSRFNLDEQIKVLKNFLRFFNEEEGSKVGDKLDLKE